MAVRVTSGAGQRARPAAAITASSALWVSSAVYSAVYLGSGLPNLMPAAVVWWPVVWSAAEYPLAIFVGAAAYRERR